MSGCGTLIAYKTSGSDFPSLPERKRGNIEMKVLKKIAFMLVMVVGLSLLTFGQKDEQKKPPKGNPPVVTPANKQPPKKDDKGKKQSIIIWKEDGGRTA